MSYVPYCETAPQTTDLRELKLELDRVRALHGPGSSQGAEAYNRLSREAGRQGRPLDGLRRYSKDETERFFAQVVTGPDGHAYWDSSSNGFTRNDGKTRAPARWWWGHLHGEITSPTLRLYQTCGDPACIHPEHQKLANFNSIKRRTDEQLLGALQVMSMRIGKTPTSTEWEENGGTPTAEIFRQRFGGTWERVCRAAGLKIAPRKVPPAAALSALRFARKALGHWPTQEEFESPGLREELQRRHLPTARHTIKRRLGSWDEALRKAGKR